MRIRIDRWLVKKGLASSRSHAEALILEGRVTRNGGPIQKITSLVSDQDQINIVQEKIYVGRGAEKLASAMTQLKCSVYPEVYLDVGSSTGGFTHYLLNQGATEVVAIDVGRHQLHETLRSDSRVHVMEETHILKVDQLPVRGITRAVMDVSFISLHKVFPKVWSLLESPKWCLMLFKPQFEVGRKHVQKGGVVKDETVIGETLDTFLRVIQEPGCTIQHCLCGLKGKKKGNQEIWVLIHE